VRDDDKKEPRKEDGEDGEDKELSINDSSSSEVYVDMCILRTSDATINSNDEKLHVKVESQFTLSITGKFSITDFNRINWEISDEWSLTIQADLLGVDDKPMKMIALSR
jgi:hypothetical protein